ncbi:DnaA ATPase domain-containing protein [Mycoplasma sp. 1018B]|uniref:DnaA ATPase domain-containing protein n=1 Tax=Mycoplasma sp. 1018B TaxID=2967302 RepID=UPI00211CACD9|nr:DnaA/Hda family protein [Mycoplasma sp. 1018B]UUM19494.1 DnaA/Hda family protein [Mycoplasma sp. 1018B]
MTFNNYVVSDFNNEAINMAKIIINGRTDFNPIFIYGSSGLGKTHLLNAISNEFLNKNKTVKYINPNVFIREMSIILQENDQNKLLEIKNLLSKVDLLIFDDFQSLAIGNKRKTINSIYSILDTRKTENKITIVASDKSLELLSNSFEDRLITRLSEGLQIEIKKPNQKDLYKVTEFLIDDLKMNHNNWDDEAIKFITRNFSSDIRKIIGALKKVLFHKETIDKDLNSKYTLITVKNILSTIQKNKKNITPETIIEYVSKYYKISKKEIIGKNRKKEVLLARNIAIYIIKAELELSFEKIGSIFGNRDHSTIINSIKKINEEINSKDPNLKQTISEINNDIYRLN